MSIALRLWQMLCPQQQLTDWHNWLNRYGLDGKCLDDADWVSFINPQTNTAVKIHFSPDDSHAFAYWLSEFSPCNQNKTNLKVINIVFSHFEQAKKQLEDVKPLIF